MIKSKMKIISFITLLFITLFTSFVNAENVVSTNETSTENVIPINETQQETTIKEGDQYIFEQDVTIDTPVDGNLFIFANTVTIKSQIGGDAFIFADTINIGVNGYVLSNLFACANTINIEGSVYNVYSLGNNLTIDGFVYRDIRSVCDTLTINGMIGRNVFVDCLKIRFKDKSDEENATVTSSGTIQGNLYYTADYETMIPEGAVSGETSFTSSNTLNISDFMYSLGTLLVTAILLWLVGLWISPKIRLTHDKTMSLKKALQIIGLGILVPVILTFVSFIILLIPITSQFMILLLCVLTILFFISTSATIIDVNTRICNKLNITKHVYTLGFLIIIGMIFWLLTLIPYVGTIISIIAIIWGIGYISYTVLISSKSSIAYTTDSSQNENTIGNVSNANSDKSKNTDQK